MKKSLEYLEELKIDKNKAMVVATSGGVDSMVLLYMLKNNGYNVICAHVHHNLRKESDKEYEFIREYCINNEIIFEGYKIDSYKNGRFTEDEARKKRYEFLFSVLDKYGTDILLTAHHGDDLIESVLMRILRGSNLSGYKGFSKISKMNNYKVIRPLVFYTKKDIEGYASINNIPHVYDKSNESKKYTRNRIRLDILPLIKKENKDANLKFLEFSEEIRDASHCIDNIVKNEFNNNFKDNILHLDKFNELNIYIKKKELEYILFSIYKDNISLINKNHINNILNLISSDNKYINLPDSLIVSKEYDKLIFKFLSNNTIENYEYILNDHVIIKDYGEIKLIEDTKEKSNYVIKLNSRDIKLPLIVRNSNNGDLMKVKNMNGSKKVSRIFIDEKICKEERIGYPILTDSDNNILWIPGVKKSEFDCYNKDNYDIIIKYVKKEINDEKE